MTVNVAYKDGRVLIQMNGGVALVLTPEEARQLHVGLAQDCPEFPTIGGRDRCPCILRYQEYLSRGSHRLPSFSAPRS